MAWCVAVLYPISIYIIFSQDSSISYRFLSSFSAGWSYVFGGEIRQIWKWTWRNLAEAPSNTHNKRSFIRTSQVCHRHLAVGRSQQVKEYKHTHTYTHTHTPHTHTQTSELIWMKLITYENQIKTIQIHVNNNFYHQTSATGKLSLRGKCPYSELFWSVFFRIQIEYRFVFSPNARKYGPAKLWTRTQRPRHQFSSDKFGKYY